LQAVEYEGVVMHWDFLFVGVSIAAIVFARRWRNPRSDAGEYIAGWGLVFYVIYIIAMTSE